ncbi:Probable dTDP-4-dehydrorhamnose reductase [hydrothermal vent metagenome]|uniref:Probable dTDP-4-dehydrorhamnose reductase n=1 Tax=hydrothermal vent metagenome TaxID=652676 RepID=A0A3B1B9R6_9ZZZZ
MRILILGGDGMLGHQLLSSWQGRHTVAVTLRQSLSHYVRYNLFNQENSIADVDVREFSKLAQVVEDFRPDAVINSVGIIKQRDDTNDAVQSIEINALLPHKLAVLCEKIEVRLVHLSTDCVFSGSKGLYREDDLPDARDLYGRSKLLGEVATDGAITLRSSIIGLELSRNKSLVEWFLAQQGIIWGFRRAIYSGVTTLEMARIIEHLLTQHPNLSGVWQVASQPINKYELLSGLLKRLPELDIEIEADDSFACDRSLDGSHFQQETGYEISGWPLMLDELAQQIQERTHCA